MPISHDNSKAGSLENFRITLFFGLSGEKLSFQFSQIDFWHKTCNFQQLKKMFLPRIVSANFNQLRSLFQSTLKSSSISLNLLNTKDIYHHKSTWELLRSLAILKVCSINYFADNSLDVSEVFVQFFFSKPSESCSFKAHFFGRSFFSVVSSCWNRTWVAMIELWLETTLFVGDFQLEM